MTEFFVYGLFDSRNPSTIFYVGQSHSLKARMSAHAGDPASRACRWCAIFVRLALG